jgi:hypothetical protein
MTIKHTLHQQRTRRKGRDMENIDVRDLPEDQAQLVAAFVEFLKQRKQQRAQGDQPPSQRAYREPLCQLASRGQRDAESAGRLCLNWAYWSG